MRRHLGAQSGVTLLEILIAMLILGVVALGSGALVRSIGLLGISQTSTNRFERPARARTMAMEYIYAEMEYLRSRSYDDLRNGGTCNTGAPAPAVNSARRLPSPGVYLAGEPQVPPLFAGADIAISDESGTTLNGCALRRITVYVYLQASDMPLAVGSGAGTVFSRGETARSFR